MLEQIKLFLIQKVVPFVANYIVRWSLKFVGSVLTYIGWEQSDYTELVVGILTFIVGIVLTKINEKKMLKQE